jgi:hypothetical protein
LSALGVGYSHYWLVAKVETSFLLHLEVIISFYKMLMKVGELLVLILLDKLKLES